MAIRKKGKYVMTKRCSSQEYKVGLLFKKVSNRLKEKKQMDISTDI